MKSVSIKRMMEATKCKTHADLAEYLGVARTTVSHCARKRGTIPTTWLLKALRKSHLNPEWILMGRMPVHLIPFGESQEDLFDFALAIVMGDKARLLAQLEFVDLIGEAYRRSDPDDTPPEEAFLLTKPLQ